MTFTVASMPGVAGSDTSPPMGTSLHTSSLPVTPSVVTPTEGVDESDASAALVPGVVVGVVLAVVLVVVVAAIVLAVCLVQRRRNKYNLDSNRTYEVPPDAYIGEYTENWCVGVLL